MKKFNYFPLLINCAVFLAGVLGTLSFAPFHLFPLAIFSTLILLSLWLNISPRRAFFRGFLYGLGLFGTGVYWVFISIHEFGNASVLFAGAITLGFIIILAFFPAFTGYVLNRYFPVTNFSKLVLAFPALWVTFEWVRSWIFTGFPWLFLGYSQTNSPLRGYAPIFSVYGVSLAVVLTSGLILQLVTMPKTLRRIYNISLTLVLTWVIGWGLSFIPWTKSKDAPLTVSLVQGSIPEELKWSADSVQMTLNRYADLTQPLWNKSQIIVWPESAIPISMQDAADFLTVLAEKASQNKATFITGVPILLPNGTDYYNAIASFSKTDSLYLKRRLVPFGEYVPFNRWLHHWLDILNVPMSTFVSGTGPVKILDANGIFIAPYICYEIAFPESAGLYNTNANMLLTISNDAWFGDSLAKPQHLQMAQMRALEMQRPVLFVSNDGITAIIDARGKITAVAPEHQPYVLTGTVQPMQGKTPLQYDGIDPILLILFGLLFYGFLFRKRL